jgi:hypothetical protein
VVQFDDRVDLIRIRFSDRGWTEDLGFAQSGTDGRKTKLRR